MIKVLFVVCLQNDLFINMRNAITNRIIVVLLIGF